MPVSGSNNVGLLRGALFRNSRPACARRSLCDRIHLSRVRCATWLYFCALFGNARCDVNALRRRPSLRTPFPCYFALLFRGRFRGAPSVSTSHLAFSREATSTHSGLFESHRNGDLAHGFKFGPLTSSCAFSRDATLSCEMRVKIATLVPERVPRRVLWSRNAPSPLTSRLAAARRRCGRGSRR